MILTTERLRAFRFNLSLFEKTAEQLAADKIIADKAIADAEIEKLRDATHAASVIKRLNEESKAQREARELAERERDELKKKVDDQTTKDLADQKKFEDLYNKEKADREADNAKSNAELSKRDTAALIREVRDAAKTAGILDPDFIELPVFAEAMKLAKVDGGKVIGADDVVAKMREVKASAFKPVETEEQRVKREADEKAEKDRKDRADQQERDRLGRFGARPAPGPASTTGDIDWSKLTPAEFEQREAEMRAQTARM